VKLSFKDFLIEVASGASADKHGKIHELLTGWHLNRLIHGQGAHMTHFRDESGLTPEEALRKHIAGMSNEELTHHNNKAMQAAEAIYSHIKKAHPDILKPNKSKGEHIRVTWTSQPHDVENLTGKKDKAQQSGGADIMITKHNKFGHVESDDHAYGANLKFLSKKTKVTHSNRGMKSIESQLGMKRGKLSRYDDEHDERMQTLFGDKTASGRNQKYRELKDKIPTSEYNRIREEVSKSDTLRTESQAKAVTDHLNNMSPDDRRHHLLNLLAPEHTNPTYQVRTNHDDNKPTHIEDTHKTVKNALSGDHHVVARGRYVHIYSGKKENPGPKLASIEFRSKGRPAGGGAQAAPKFSSEMLKYSRSEV
jgi:hypothetical protein